MVLLHGFFLCPAGIFLSTFNFLLIMIMRVVMVLLKRLLEMVKRARGSWKFYGLEGILVGVRVLQGYGFWRGTISPLSTQKKKNWCM